MSTIYFCDFVFYILYFIFLYIYDMFLWFCVREWETSAIKPFQWPKNRKPRKMFRFQNGRRVGRSQLHFRHERTSGPIRRMLVTIVNAAKDTPLAAFAARNPPFFASFITIKRVNIHFPLNKICFPFFFWDVIFINEFYSSPPRLTCQSCPILKNEWVIHTYVSCIIPLYRYICITEIPGIACFNTHCNKQKCYQMQKYSCGVSYINCNHCIFW
jgi:hypothetical protein